MMDSNITSNITNGTNATALPPAPAPGGMTSAQLLTVKICLIVIAVIASFGNGMVIYFITTRRRLRTKTNVMVVSLAVSDLFVAIAIIPSFLTCLYVECDNQLSKLFYDAFLFISVCNLCSITFDRFMAVTRPLRYHMKMTKRKVIVMVILSWVVPSIVSIVPVAWLYTDTGPVAVAENNKIFYTLQVVVFMFFPCCIMFVAYAVIFNIAWKQTRHIRHVLNSLSTTNGGASRRIPTSSTREAKATVKVFGTVVFMFVFCWSLSAFRTIVLNYDLLVLHANLVLASRIILVSNSAINPIIYALWKKDIKNEIRKMLKLNTRMVRPSSGTFRSSQDLRYETSTNTLTFDRKQSRAGSMQDIALPPETKTSDKPLNGIINEVMAENAEVMAENAEVMAENAEVMAENAETVSKIEAEEQPTPKVTPVECGEVNLVAETDGMV